MTRLLEATLLVLEAADAREERHQPELIETSVLVITARHFCSQDAWNMENTLRTTRVAAVQAESIVLDRERTVEKACGLIAEASENGAELVVFPELFIPRLPFLSICPSC